MNRALLDTSVVLRLFDASDPLCLIVSTTVAAFIRTGGTILVSPQVLYEARVVLTRPMAENGLGRSAIEFAILVERLRDYATLLPDPPDLVARWLDVCARHGIVGKRCHDARLVAWMEAYGVDTILTLNPRDFAAFPVAVLPSGA